MKYRIDVPHFGKFFTVPCSAVENYIKTADANYVKVLLCLLCSNSDTADVHSVAEICGLSVSQVEDGVLFWKNCGVISAEPCADSTDTPPEALPPKAAAASAPISREAMPVCAADAVNPMKNTAAAKSVVRYSNKEIAEKVRADKELKTLFDEIQRVFGRPITGTETAGLINIYEYYGYDVPSIIMICEFCRSIGKPKIAYIETVARDWFSRGICDFAQVENEIIRQGEQHGFDSAVARALGIEGKLTKKQEEYFAQWKEWGFDEKAIDLAGQRCRENKNKTDIRYINGILNRWKQENLMTAEAVEEQERQFRESRAKNEDSGENSYDLNEWRNMAAAFNPNTLGFEEDDDI